MAMLCKVNSFPPSILDSLSPPGGCSIDQPFASIRFETHYAVVAAEDGVPNNAFVFTYALGGGAAAYFR